MEEKLIKTTTEMLANFGRITSEALNRDIVADFNKPAAHEIILGNYVAAPLGRGSVVFIAPTVPDGVFTEIGYGLDAIGQKCSPPIERRAMETDDAYRERILMRPGQ